MRYELFDQDELIALIGHDMKVQDYTHALEKVKFMMQAEQFPVSLFSLAGKLYATLELFERARFYFAEYIRHVPNAQIELFQLGMVERDIGNLDAAIAIWEDMDDKLNNPEAQYYLADVYVSQNNLEKARSSLLNILENAPDGSPFIPMADKLLNRLKAEF